MPQRTLDTIPDMANSFLASVEYPDCDGEPRADNTVQRDTIVNLATAVRRWYSDRPDVFVDIADTVGHRSEILGFTRDFRKHFFDLRTSSASLLRPDELGATVDQLTGEVRRMRREVAAVELAVAAAALDGAAAACDGAAAARDGAAAAHCEAEQLQAAGIDPRA